MPLIDPKAAQLLMALGQHIRDEHRIKSSLVYDPIVKPVLPLVVGKPRAKSRHQRRAAAARNK